MRLPEVAAMLGMTELLGRLPKQLSGGQRQRVAMGRALVRDPTVFLLDEPLSNLDAKLRVQVRAEIGELQRRTGTCPAPSYPIGVAGVLLLLLTIFSF
jgi:multiple sugar transport system ATP-binding protein